MCGLFQAILVNKLNRHKQNLLPKIAALYAPCILAFPLLFPIIGCAMLVLDSSSIQALRGRISAREEGTARTH